MPESETEYLNALIDAAELGAQKALLAVGAGKPFLSLKEAQRIYGYANVNRWLSEGLVSSAQDAPNGKVRIDRVKIDAVARVSNRANFYRDKK